MKKAIAAILLVLSLFAFISLLTACSKSNVSTLVYHGKRFQTVKEYDDCKILVDTETGVEYAVRKGNGYKDSITVLFDSYGNPLLYSGYDAREDRT